MSHPKERMLPGLNLNPQMTALSEFEKWEGLVTKGNKVAIKSPRLERQ